VWMCLCVRVCEWCVYEWYICVGVCDCVCTRKGPKSLHSSSAFSEQFLFFFSLLLDVFSDYLILGIDCAQTLSHVQLFSVHEIFHGKNTGSDCHFLLQQIFPTQGLKLCLLHCQVYSLSLSHLGSPLYRLPSFKIQKLWR